MNYHLKPLAEQTLVITGASSGIGLATAQAAARAGARVMLAARDGAALARIVEELNAAGGQTAYCATDVSDEAQVQALAALTIAEFGGFDTWVNDAGIDVITRSEDLSTAEHHQLFEVNYFGLVYGSLEAVRHFREAGKSGALINLGSADSDLAQPFSVAYSATKHAIKGFTDGLRVELMRDTLPISVTLIKPSSIRTRIFDHSKSNLDGQGKGPGPQYAPEVVADAILFAAQHHRRDIAVGSMSAIGGRVGSVAPGLIDLATAAMPYSLLIDQGTEPEADSLNDVPNEGNLYARQGSGRRFSVSTQAQMHPVLGLGLAALAGAALALAVVGRS
jgi:short-subunit dehydrogenase